MQKEINKIKSELITKTNTVDSLKAEIIKLKEK